MNLPIHFRTIALTEYFEAIRWYEKQSTGLGDQFEAEVQDVLDTIADRPDRYPFASADVRQAPVHVFPYCVYYRARLDRVIIISVFHESRDPKEWQSRV